MKDPHDVLQSIKQHMDSPEKLKSFIGDGTVLKVTDECGRTALHLAAMYGNAEVVKAIIDQCPIAKNPTIIKANDKYLRTPLHFAGQYGHIEVVKAIMCSSKASEANDKDWLTTTKDRDGLTPLHWAVVSGYIKLTKAIIAQDPKTIEAKDNNGLTALDWAAQWGHIEVVGLLKHQQIINKYGGLGRILLCFFDRRVGVGLAFGMGFLASCAYCTKNTTVGFVSLSGGLIGLATSYIAKYFINLDDNAKGESANQQKGL